MPDNKIKEIIDGMQESISSINYKEAVPYAAWMQKEKYIKLFIDNVLKIVVEQDISATSFLVLNALISCLDYQSNCLVYSNGKPMRKDGLLNYVNVKLRDKYKHRTIEDCLHELKKAELINIARTGNSNSYYVNPCLYFKGSYISKTLYNLFFDYIERHPEYKRDFQADKKIVFNRGK